MTNLTLDAGSARCLWHVYKSGSRHQGATERAKSVPTTRSHPRLPLPSFPAYYGMWVVTVMEERGSHPPTLLVGNMNSSGVNEHGRTRAFSMVVPERLASVFII